MILLLLTGWLIADFLSGVVHWFEDQFITSNTPLLGALVGAPNELHHSDPQAFLASSFFDRSWTTWLAVAPISLAWLAAFGFSWAWFAATIGGCLANETHAWAHKAVRPAWISALQETGVFQRPAQHSRHHRGSMTTHYCTLSGWLNPWLELIRFWYWLERGLALIGIRPVTKLETP